MVLLLGASKFTLFESFGSNRLAPELPELAIWALNFVNSFLYVLVALSLVWWTRRGRRVLLPALAAAIAAWGQFEGLRPPAVKEVTLSFPNLPAALDGYRIVQISDLHCSSAARGWRTRAVVAAANAADADLICLTGDCVDGRVARLKGDMTPLKGLRARDGVWWVTGNHEFYQDAFLWERFYRECGFRFLSNACVRPRPGLALAGVDDPAVTRFGGYGNAKPDVAEAFRAARADDFRVLLSHRPGDFRENVRRHGVDLQLSGHTHGGIAPLVGRVVARANAGFLRGLYRDGASCLYVSPGAGLWAGFPLRFFDPSEITVFTLKSPHSRALSRCRAARLRTEARFWYNTQFRAQRRGGRGRKPRTKQTKEARRNGDQKAYASCGEVRGDG